MHHAKSEFTYTHKYLKLLRPNCKYFIALTATMMHNNPQEFFNLLDIVSNQNLSEELSKLLLYSFNNIEDAEKDFGFRFNEWLKQDKGPIIGLKNSEKYRHIVLRYVELLDENKMEKNFKRPKAEIHMVYVKLTPHEWANYKYALKAITNEEIKEISN